MDKLRAEGHLPSFLPELYYEAANCCRNYRNVTSIAFDQQLTLL